MPAGFAKVGIRPTVGADLQRLLGDLTFRGNSAASVAAQAAVSRTVTTGVTRISRRIGEEVNLKISDIKKLITAKRGSYDKPEGSIVVTRKTTWLADFLSASRRDPTKPGKGPLVVKARKRASGKYGTSETIPRGFVAVMARSRFPGIFQRQGKQRLPIHRMRGPTAMGILVHAHGQNGAATVLDEVIDDLGEVLEKNLLSQIDRFIK